MGSGFKLRPVRFDTVLKKFFFKFLFGCPGSSLLWAGFSPAVVSRGYSLLGCVAPHCGGLSRGARAPGHKDFKDFTRRVGRVAVAPGL